MLPRFLVSLAFALLAGLAISSLTPHGSLAQGLDALPDRPIARAEVVAVVKRQFAAMDTNHDGVVTQAEFERFRAHQPDAPATGVAAMAHVGGHWFEHGDANADGRVTLAEAEVRPMRMFDMADTNGDGIVSVGERQAASALMALTGR